MEQHRPEPGVALRNSGEDTVAAHHLGPRRTIVVERQDASDLAAHCLDVVGALNLTHNGSIWALTQEHSRLLVKAVDAERQSHDGLYRVPRPSPWPEAEAGGAPQVEITEGRYLERVSNVNHGPIVRVIT
jgi:hypothetical protein